jgi:hypothetical protein
MIQVCSRCGTRWNVRDRQRQWCPRCQGTLLAPSGPAPGSEWSAQPGEAASRPASQTPPPKIPPGYRWIAVRPGAPPPQRRRRGPLGPTPRYTTIPPWGLVEYFPPDDQQDEQTHSGPSVRAVRRLLTATTIAFGVAAFMLLVRYVLLLVNRGMLLNPWLADGVTWLGIVAAVVAFFLLLALAIVLANWLIARRAAAFAHRGQTDPRPAWALRWGCLLPFVNLVWAPVFVYDLARIEARLSLMRRPILVWTILWTLCTILSVFAFATSFPDTPQGVADNTVTTTIAYLLSVAVLLLTRRIYLGFERTPVERAARRWVLVSDDRETQADARQEDQRVPESAVAVET